MRQEVPTEHKEADLEANDTPGTFDIRLFFEDSVRNRLEQGGKIKKMSVVAKNLTVVGEVVVHNVVDDTFWTYKGSAGTKIPDNLSPLFDLAKLFWPPNW